jgi:hypothetical protein
LFAAIDTNYITVYVCVNDMCLLARMLEEKRLLPAGLALADFLAVDVRCQFRWYYCQVFPRVPPPQQQLRYRLIFPESLNSLSFSPPSRSILELVQLANCFEVHMEETRKFRELRDWADLVSVNVNLLLRGNLAYLMLHPEIPVSRDLRQLMTLSCFDTASMALHFQDFRALARRWDKFVASRSDDGDWRKKINGCRTAERWIWEGIRTVRSTGKIRLSRMFQLLMIAMSQFEQVAHRPGFGFELLCKIIKDLPGYGVVVPLVIFSGMIAHNPDFVSEEERKIWTKLEECISFLLNDDPELMAGITSMKEGLQQQAEEEMRVAFRLEGS